MTEKWKSWPQWPKVLSGVPLTSKYKRYTSLGAPHPALQVRWVTRKKALSHLSFLYKKRKLKMTDYSNFQNAQSSQDVGALIYCKVVSF